MGSFHLCDTGKPEDPIENSEKPKFLENYVYEENNYRPGVPASGFLQYSVAVETHELFVFISSTALDSNNSVSLCLNYSYEGQSLTFSCYLIVYRTFSHISCLVLTGAL